MASSNTHDPPGAGSSDDLTGLKILLVEDSRDVGEAVKEHLELLGAMVAGPATTTAEAERLLTEHLQTSPSSTSIFERANGPTA